MESALRLREGGRVGPRLSEPCAPVASSQLCQMAKGIGENPVKSRPPSPPWGDNPAPRDELVQAAADSEAPAEVINFFKSLPAERYGSLAVPLRDFPQAGGRRGASRAPPGPLR